MCGGWGESVVVIFSHTCACASGSSSKMGRKSVHPPSISTDTSNLCTGAVVQRCGNRSLRLWNLQTDTASCGCFGHSKQKMNDAIFFPDAFRSHCLLSRGVKNRHAQRDNYRIFLRIFMREVTKVTEIKREVEICIEMGTFLLN